MKILILTVLFMASFRISMLAEDTIVTNPAVASASQAAPMKVMVNGPSGRATVPMEFWLDTISIGKSSEHLERGIVLVRSPQYGYIFSITTNRLIGVGDILNVTNTMWLVPDVGLVFGSSQNGCINLYLHSTKAGSRSEAIAKIENAALNLEMPYKGASQGEIHRVVFQRELGEDFYNANPKSAAPSPSCDITKLGYTNQTWIIEIKSCTGKGTARIVLDSNFKLKSARRISN